MTATAIKQTGNAFGLGLALRICASLIVLSAGAALMLVVAFLVHEIGALILRVGMAVLLAHRLVVVVAQAGLLR